MPKGFLALILHAHLPFVRHPEYEFCLEENWLFEAITECYLPLLDTFQRLAEEGVPFRLTVSFTPPLLYMLSDPLLQQRYRARLYRLLELAEREVQRTWADPAFAPVAALYRERLQRMRHLYEERCRCDLVAAFRELEAAGRLELMASAATHGYLPLLDLHPEAVRAQIKAGVETFRRFFGHDPLGFWLPECGFQPGQECFLAAEGIRYFIVETHGLLYASPRPRYGTFAPVYCPAGVAAFGRDVESSKQVWSAQEGYPGDYDYRDFYRDIGYDLDLDYIGPYLHPPGLRGHTGLKYHRITGRTEHKEPYNPQWAREKAALHAGNFMFNREKQVEYLASVMDRAPIVVAPYDAELFGHWWFEGPQWLEFLIRKIAYDQETIKLCTPGDYLRLYPRNQLSTPSGSSWGWKGYHEVWLNGSNDWIYRHLHKASQRMIELANAHPSAEGLRGRALRQAGRELLLAQSSDWAFIMKTGTMVQYATRRFQEHIHRFTQLYHQIKEGRIDEPFLARLEGEDNLFPELDYRLWASSDAQRAPKKLAIRPA
ncbi:MAG: DUF1957 domain-containing protein [Bacillota bacterium]|nr:DUF1957 domain-containing protein [Bacillota bacterium]